MKLALLILLLLGGILALIIIVVAASGALLSRGYDRFVEREGSELDGH